MQKKPINKPQVNALQSLLIGRGSELAAFAAALEGRQPTVVVVAGESRTGKTALLQAFQVMANAQNWRTAGGANQRTLTVTPITDKRNFYGQVLAFFDEPGDSRDAVQSQIFPAQTVVELPTALQEPNSFTVEDSKLSSFEVQPDLIAQLKERAPVLLLIDGYEPNPEFNNWFKTTFIEAVRRSQEPLVIVIADRIASLKGQQDEFFPLSPLTRQDIREQFESLGHEIKPPLVPGELDVYVEAAVKNLAVLIRLYRVLALARSSDRAKEEIP
jgi:hypothetical protein